jgi:ABC-2 type transport system ATP-binding protein
VEETLKAIEVNKLTRYYDQFCAVDKLTFEVDQGEIFGFLGPNGAGKTTTLSMLTGQLRPSSGSARVAGYDVHNQRKQLKPRIGVVFEYQNLYERQSGRDNLRFCARLYGVGRKDVEEVLAKVGLTGRAGDKVKKYSNGMKQRLLIARALLHKPEVIFLDEPTRGLDPNVARDLRAVVRDLANQGVTIFLTTHYMEEADQLCDRVVIFDHGQIVDIGTGAELKARHGAATLEDVFIQLTGRFLGQGRYDNEYA